MFIVIEGPDQVGKTEQAGLLAEYLRGIDRQVDSYSFPSRGTPTGRVVREWLSDRGAVPDGEVSRDLAVTFQCVQLVDKYAAVPAVLRSLREDRDVVCCRWWQSAHAYGLDEGLPLDWVTDTCGLLPRADLNVLLDLSPVLAVSRGTLAPDGRSLSFKAMNRTFDRYDRDLGKQERVRRHYLALWGANKTSRMTSWPVVDGSGTRAEVCDRITSLLEVRRA